MPCTSALDGLALGIEVDGLGAVLGVPPPAVVPVPAFVPGEPALPLMRPLAFGTRLTSLLPGAVITEPPTEVPGELLVIVPPPAEVAALPETWAAACWLQASKSACVCATAGAAISATATAASEMTRVKLAMGVSLLGTLRRYK